MEGLALRLRICHGIVWGEGRSCAGSVDSVELLLLLLLILPVLLLLLLLPLSLALLCYYRVIVCGEGQGSLRYVRAWWGGRGLFSINSDPVYSCARVRCCSESVSLP